MDKKIKAKWLKALRSGKYKQGKSRLCNSYNEYCCLGVLADVMKEGNLSRAFLPDEVAKLAGISVNGELPENAPKEFFGVNGISGGGKTLLSAFNDRGLSFKRIAQLIEKYL